MWRSIGMDLWGVLSCGFEGVWAVCGGEEIVGEEVYVRKKLRMILEVPIVKRHLKVPFTI